MKVVKKEHHPLVHRTELVLESDNTTTPSNADFVAAVAKDTGVPEDQVVMQKIDTHYGDNKSRAVAYAYDSKEAKVKFEMKTKHQKEQEKKAAEEAAKKAEEAKKAAEEAKAAAAAEAPAEEAKPEEAAPAEEKPAEAPAEGAE